MYISIMLPNDGSLKWKRCKGIYDVSKLTMHKLMIPNAMVVPLALNLAKQSI